MNKDLASRQKMQSLNSKSQTSGTKQVMQNNMETRAMSGPIVRHGYEYNPISSESVKRQMERIVGIRIQWTRVNIFFLYETRFDIQWRVVAGIITFHQAACFRLFSV